MTQAANLSGTGICVAWVNFNGTSGASPVIRASFNVSSVVRNGTGDYTITFTNALPDVNYSATSCLNFDIVGNRNALGNFPYNQAPTTTTARVASVAGNNAALTDVQYASFAFFR
jgi:hypothetical protein